VGLVAPERSYRAHRVTARGLDADDVGTQVGHQLGCEDPGAAGQVEDAYPVERAGATLSSWAGISGSGELRTIHRG
jgi:hypothetical protein